MKDGNEEKAAEVSKMSLAAKKGWETRRKRYGYVKKTRFEDEPEIVVEVLKRGHRGRKSKDEQLKGYRKGYRKGYLVPKGRQERNESSVILSGVRGEKYREFLYGRNYREEIMIRKLFEYSKQLAEKLIFEGRVLEAPKVVVQG